MEQKDKRKRGGFTLVEVLVVMAIVAILAAVTVPTFTGYIDKAREEVYLTEARTVSMGIQTYIAEQYAQGTLNRSNIKNDLMSYPLGDPNHALTELLKGAYTEGGQIILVEINTNHASFERLVYEVDGYEVEIMAGETATITKKEK